jgi:hypothetical protein
MTAPIGESLRDLIGDQGIVGAAEHQGVDRRSLISGG